MIPSLAWPNSIWLSTPEHWKALAARLPDELARRRPAPQEWSAVECLQHMLDVERVYYTRVQSFLAGQDFKAFDPLSQGSQADPHRPLSAAAEEFASLRARSLELLETIQEQDLPRCVRHQELGPVKLEEMLNTWAAHDLNHTMQAERAVMQPFIQACGAWESYFRAVKIG
jgi:uncharacterized damage-inducible protein DinB